VNSFSDFRIKKIGSECCDNGKPCFFKQNTDGEPIFEDEDGVEYDSFTYDLIVKLNSLKRSRLIAVIYLKNLILRI
jgi:hypothetical protein